MILQILSEGFITKLRFMIIFLYRDCFLYTIFIHSFELIEKVQGFKLLFKTIIQVLLVKSSTKIIKYISFASPLFLICQHKYVCTIYNGVSKLYSFTLFGVMDFSPFPILSTHSLLLYLDVVYLWRTCKWPISSYSFDIDDSLFYSITHFVHHLIRKIVGLAFINDIHIAISYLSRSDDLVIWTLNFAWSLSMWHHTVHHKVY